MLQSFDLKEKNKERDRDRERTGYNVKNELIGKDLRRKKSQEAIPTVQVKNDDPPNKSSGRVCTGDETEDRDIKKVESTELKLN